MSGELHSVYDLFESDDNWAKCMWVYLLSRTISAISRLMLDKEMGDVDDEIAGNCLERLGESGFVSIRRRSFCEPGDENAPDSADRFASCLVSRSGEKQWTNRLAL